MLTTNSLPLLAALLSLAHLSTSSPTPFLPLVTASSSGVPISASQLVSLAPLTSTCPSSAPAAECRTAAVAAPALTAAFANHGVTSPAEAAALLSLQIFESASFQYARNHFPGRPGQGTRNMQMPAFNLLYAKSIPALAPKVSALTGGQAAASLSPDVLDKVLGLILENDAWDFGSAAWFTTTQCGVEVRKGLQAGTEQGWVQWLTSCVGTTVTEERKAGWVKAKGVLGVKA